MSGQHFQKFCQFRFEKMQIVQAAFIPFLKAFSNAPCDQIDTDTNLLRMLLCIAGEPMAMATACLE